MNIKDDILIEKYLNNQLPKELVAEFIDRLEKDEAFKEYFLFEKELFETLNENQWSFLSQKANLRAKEYQELLNSDEIINVKEAINSANIHYKKTVKNYTRFVYSGIVAASLLLCIYFLVPKKLSTEELYFKYASIEEYPSLIQRGNDADSLVIGENYFNDKKYLLASTVFSNELKKDYDNSNIYLYLSQCQIELKNYAEAEKTLEKLIDSNLIDAQKGLWFRSLLYLKLNQLQKVKADLKRIIDNSFYNHKKASQLLIEVQKIE